jgi:hypothetical protein
VIAESKREGERERERKRKKAKQKVLRSLFNLNGRITGNAN